MRWFILLVVLGCGSEVQTGRNSEDRRTLDGPGGASDEGGESGSADARSGGQLGLTCFGGVEVLAADLAGFCAGKAQDLRGGFGFGIAALCDDLLYANMLEEGCAWPGTGDPLRHFLFVSKTDLESRDDVFAYSAVAALTLEDSSDEDVERVFHELTPEFEPEYERLPGLTMSNMVVDREAGTGSFTAELATSSTVARYDGLVNVYRIAPKLTVITEEAVGNLSQITHSRSLMITRQVGDHRVRSLIFDEKGFYDGGQHDIAYRVLLKNAKDRMESVYRNSVKWGE